MMKPLNFAGQPQPREHEHLHVSTTLETLSLRLISYREQNLTDTRTSQWERCSSFTKRCARLSFRAGCARRITNSTIWIIRNRLYERFEPQETLEAT